MSSLVPCIQAQCGSSRAISPKSRLGDLLCSLFNLLASWVESSSSFLDPQELSILKTSRPSSRSLSIWKLPSIPRCSSLTRTCRCQMETSISGQRLILSSPPPLSFPCCRSHSCSCCAAAFSHQTACCCCCGSWSS